MLMIDCVWAARSRLPFSLTYIVLLTRGCSPWRPAAVMGTTWGESLHSSPGFQGPASAAPDAALRGRGAYLQSSRFQANPPLTKKRQLFPGLRPSSPGSIASQLRPPRGRRAPHLGSGILTRFPFCTLSWLIINLIDFGYFKTYIYSNTHLFNSSGYKLTIKLENCSHFEFFSHL